MADDDTRTAFDRAARLLYVNGCTASAHWAKLLDEAGLLIGRSSDDPEHFVDMLREGVLDGLRRLALDRGEDIEGGVQEFTEAEYQALATLGLNAVRRRSSDDTDRAALADLLIRWRAGDPAVTNSVLWSTTYQIAYDAVAACRAALTERPEG